MGHLKTFIICDAIWQMRPKVGSSLHIWEKVLLGQFFRFKNKRKIIFCRWISYEILGLCSKLAKQYFSQICTGRLWVAFVRSHHICIKLSKDNFMLVFFSLFQPDLYIGNRSFYSKIFFSFISRAPITANWMTTTKRRANEILNRWCEFICE